MTIFLGRFLFIWVFHMDVDIYPKQFSSFKHLLKHYENKCIDVAEIPREGWRAHGVKQNPERGERGGGGGGGQGLEETGRRWRRSWWWRRARSWGEDCGGWGGKQWWAGRSPRLKPATGPESLMRVGSSWLDWVEPSVLKAEREPFFWSSEIKKALLLWLCSENHIAGPKLKTLFPSSDSPNFWISQLVILESFWWACFWKM